MILFPGVDDLSELGWIIDTIANLCTAHDDAPDDRTQGAS